MSAKQAVVPLLALANLFMLAFNGMTNFDTTRHHEQSAIPTLDRWLSSFIDNDEPLTTNNFNGSSLLIIASVPRDTNHVASLWSQLECLDVDHVIVSAPDWARDQVIEPVVDKARRALNLPIDTFYIPTPKKDTDRYDVGLWCEALLNHKKQIQNASFVTLINDSVYAIRSHDKSLETISHLKQHRPNEYDFVGLTYYQQVNQTNPWPESIMRTFTAQGIRKFQKYACESEFLCGKHMGPKQFHRCIVDNYEIGIVKTMHSTPLRSIGLYPALPPYEGQRHGRVTAWSAGNISWWKHLVKKYDFGLQKVAFANSTPTQCTTKMDSALIDYINYRLDPPPPPCRRRRVKCAEIEREYRRLKKEKKQKGARDLF